MQILHRFAAAEPKPQRAGRELRVYWLALIALVLTLYIELFNHKVFTTGFASFWDFVTTKPLALLVCYLLVLVTLLPSLLFRRQVFVCTLVGIFWIVCGSVNGFILLKRMTPFTTSDLAVLGAGLDTLPNYLSTGYLVLLGVALAAALTALGFLLVKGPRSGRPLARRAVRCAACMVVGGALLAGSWIWAFHTRQLSTTFANLAFAYRDYGFSYCFLQTWLNKGVRQPSGYSQASMEQITVKIDEDAQVLGTPQDANVIFVQLESFLDPDEVEGLSLNQDPIPNWHRLEAEWSSGYLRVPVLGAGTANTEFEMLTGMSTRFFGPGEYPYKPCMQTKTAESIAYNLSELGYTAHAIHNHYATFYSRNVVYANLGFDDFTSLEYMPLTERTPRKWTKDSVLTSQILQAMDATEGRDFVFTVTVQDHGSYPDEPVLEHPAYTVAQCPEQVSVYSMEYYVNQLYETDNFIGALVRALEQRDEPCVLVLYSDHLPALNLEASDLRSGSLYKTKYLVWDNIGLEQQEENLYAYQLAAEVLQRMNISNGLLLRYQQFCRSEPDYQANLKALEYDALYGKNYLGLGSYQVKELKMGTVDLEITGIYREGDQWYMSGEHFTPYCKVTICGDILSTTYIDEHTLQIDDELDDPESLQVTDFAISVVDKHKEVLSDTE